MHTPQHRASRIASVFMVLIFGCTTTEDKQRARSKTLLPNASPTQRAAMSPNQPRTVTTMRLRVYATPAYRRATLQWRDAFQARLEDVHTISKTALGVQFHVDSFHTWTPKTPEEDLVGLLSELEEHDDAHGTDRVIALVGPLPTQTYTTHDLGLARVLGKHFILRSSNDNIDLTELRDSLNELPEEELLRVYNARKIHRDRVLFLHEWAHTLGALHTKTRSSLMFASICKDQAAFGEDNIHLMQTALRHHTPLRARSLEQDRELHTALSDVVNTRSQKRTTWSGRSIQDAKALFAPPSNPAEIAQDHLIRASQAAQRGDFKNAWTLILPALDGHNPTALRLACSIASRLSLPKAQRACSRAIQANPRDLLPRLDLLQSHPEISPASRALLHEVAALHNTSPLPPPPKVTEQLAAQHIRHRQPSMAVALLKNLPKTRRSEELRRVASNLQKRFGLPHTKVPTQREDLYIHATQEVLRASSEPSLKPLRAARKTLVDTFPETPAAYVAMCAVELRTRPTRRTVTLCKTSLNDSPAYAVGLFFTALSHTSQRAHQDAITLLERCVQIDPGYDPAWVLLLRLVARHSTPKHLQQLKDLRTHSTTP